MISPAERILNRLNIGRSQAIEALFRGLSKIFMNFLKSFVIFLRSWIESLLTLGILTSS